MFSRDDFFQHLNTDFLIYPGPEKTVRAELTEVSEVVESPPQESFSIVFQIPAVDEFEPGIYTVGHDKMGRMEIFLSPFRSDGKVMKLEAVFNRLI